MAAGKVTASSLAEDTLQPVKDINSSHRSSLSLICFLCPWRECKQGKSNRLRRHFLGISYLVQQSCFFKFLYLLSFSSRSLIFLSLRVYILIVLLLFFFSDFPTFPPFCFSHIFNQCISFHFPLSKKNKKKITKKIIFLVLRSFAMQISFLIRWQVLWGRRNLKSMWFSSSPDSALQA